MTETSLKSNSKFGKILKLLFPLFLIILGVIFLVKSALIGQIFRVAGGLFLLFGIIEIVIYASTLQYEKKPRHLGNGIVLAILGAILILVPFAVNLIPYCIAILVILDGTVGVQNALTIKKAGANATIPLLTGIACILIGLIIFVCAWRSNADLSSILVGILLIGSGVIRFINQIMSILAKGTEPISENDVIDVPVSEDKTDSTL